MEIGQKIYHRGRKQEGIYTEACDYMMKNELHDSTSIFIDFGEEDDILEVCAHLCDKIDEEGK